MERNISILSRLQVGDVITADLLNAITQSININTRAIASPKQIDADNSDGGGTNYAETGRETTTVQVFDQNDENYAEIERIESVTFENDSGDTLTLAFNNT